MQNISELMKRLNIRRPLIVAPMAGGPSSARLVAASSKAGALGSMGAAYSTPQAIEKFVQDVRRETDRPFAINLFIPHAIPKVETGLLDAVIRATAPYRSELGLPVPALDLPYEENFDAQFEAALRANPTAISFVFGLLPAEYVKAAKRENVFLIGTATTSEEAQALEASGIDAIVLQGIEAGGHRGIFDATGDDAEIKAFDLLAACRAKIRLPLIAAGAIMNEQDIQRALSQGAEAVQMGTAFLACEEAGTSAPYKARLLEAGSRDTKTTRVFSGRLARGITNRFMQQMEDREAPVLPFPAQNKLTRDLRTASAAKGSADFLSLWAGTGAGELWQGPAGALIEQLFPQA